MTKVAATPLYGKKPFKNLLWNQRTDFYKTWYVALGTQAHHSLFKLWPWVDLTYFTARSNLVRWVVVFFEKVNFSESKAAYDLKVGRCRYFIELMKVCEYWRSRSFLFLAQGQLFMKIQTSFTQKPQPFWTKFCTLAFRLILCTWCWSHDQDGRHAHIWYKISGTGWPISLKLGCSILDSSPS